MVVALNLSLQNYFVSLLNPNLYDASQTTQITGERTGLIFEKNSNVFTRVAFPLFVEGQYDLRHIEVLAPNLRSVLGLIMTEPNLYEAQLEDNDSFLPFSIRRRKKPSFRIGVEGIEKLSLRNFWQVDYYAHFNLENGSNIRDLTERITELSAFANDFFMILVDYSKQKEFDFMKH
jgi:hypothetical protein